MCDNDPQNQQASDAHLPPAAATEVQQALCPCPDCIPGEHAPPIATADGLHDAQSFGWVMVPFPLQHDLDDGPLDPDVHAAAPCGSCAEYVGHVDELQGDLNEASATNAALLEKIDGLKANLRASRGQLAALRADNTDKQAHIALLSGDREVLLGLAAALIEDNLALHAAGAEAEGARAAAVMDAANLARAMEGARADIAAYAAYSQGLAAKVTALEARLKRAARQESARRRAQLVTSALTAATKRPAAPAQPETTKRSKADIVTRALVEQQEQLAGIVRALAMPQEQGNAVAGPSARVQSEQAAESSASATKAATAEQTKVTTGDKPNAEASAQEASEPKTADAGDKKAKSSAVRLWEIGAFGNAWLPGGCGLFNP